MFLCCVSILRSFQSNLDFYEFLKLLQNLAKDCTWSLTRFHQKLLGENSLFLLHFLIHIHVLLLSINFELVPTKF